MLANHLSAQLGDLGGPVSRGLIRRRLSRRLFLGIGRCKRDTGPLWLNPNHESITGAAVLAEGQGSTHALAPDYFDRLIRG
jgi:hypothetical protein